MRRTRIVLAGQSAAALLDRAARLTVFATFDRSLYLRADDGALLCLGLEALAPGPLMALCTPWFESGTLPEVGAVLERRGGCLQSGAHVLELSGFRIWIPPPIPQALPDGPARALRQLPRKCLPGEGLAPLLPLLIADSPAAGRERPGGEGTAQGLLLRQAWTGFELLRAWMASGDPAGTELRAGVGALIGLGPGLTPSGDDALAGMLLALGALRLDAWRDALAAVVRELAGEGTNAISRAHLEAASTGQGAAPLHAALHALLRGDALMDVAESLGHIGHSSGWDAFTGLVLALTASWPPDAQYGATGTSPQH